MKSQKLGLILWKKGVFDDHWSRCIHLEREEIRPGVASFDSLIVVITRVFSFFVVGLFVV